MNATGAVVFLPREGNGPSLMLEELLFDPAALWLAESLRAAGVERFFVVCHTDDQARAAACFPAGTEVVTGGGGGGAGARRGAGESKLEYDRRHVRRRIDALRERLEELERRRAETRKSREKSGVPVVALVGYTNVGKSSLLNRLCGAQVLEADMLFATLDPTARRLSLPSGLACVAVDTVGFVSRLPHNLVQAFKSTLEEAAFADVILKVCDASDPEAAAQLAVTDDVLGELGCGDIPQIVVYNKCDRVENAALFDTSAVRTSAVTGEGLDALLARLDAALAGRVRRITVLLPYDKLGEATPMRENGTVLTEEYRPEGVYLEGIVKTMDLHRFTPYLV